MASPGKMSISELVGHCQLREDGLDLEVTNDRFHEICRSLSQWRRLAPILNVTEAVEDLENDRGNEEMKKNAFLTVWKQKYAMTATYRKLIEALLRIERAEDARKICQLLSGILYFMVVDERGAKDVPFFSMHDNGLSYSLYLCHVLMRFPTIVNRGPAHRCVSRNIPPSQTSEQQPPLRS